MICEQVHAYDHAQHQPPNYLFNQLFLLSSVKAKQIDVMSDPVIATGIIDNNEKEDVWWHPELNDVAELVPAAQRSEMKQRILSSNIRKEKLALNENTERMRDFFEREIRRYNNRRRGQGLKRQLRSDLFTAETTVEELKQQVASLQKELEEKANRITQLEEEARMHTQILEQQQRLLRQINERYGQAKQQHSSNRTKSNKKTHHKSTSKKEQSALNIDVNAELMKIAAGL